MLEHDVARPCISCKIWGQGGVQGLHIQCLLDVAAAGVGQLLDWSLLLYNKGNPTAALHFLLITLRKAQLC